MIACLRLPYFAATIARRADPALLERPLLLVRYANGRGKVIALCPQAESVGVQVGMSLSRARAICPEAQVTVLESSPIRRVLESVLSDLTDYSQWIEAERNVHQTAWIAIDLGKLRPSEGGQMAETIIARLERDYGLRASVGLASNRFVARAAAALNDQVTLVRPGDEVAFLAPLPADHLPLDAEIARRLDLFGLRQIGQVAALPRAAMLAQFGKEGVRLHKLACGEDSHRVAKYQPPLVESAAHQFEPPLEDRLILGQVLGTLTTQLTAHLTTTQQTCREITLRLKLTDRSEREAQTRPPTPLHTAPSLQRVVNGLLEKLTLPAPVTAIEVSIGRLEPLQPQQLTLFDSLMPTDPRPALLDVVTRCESAHVYTAMLLTSSMLPEQVCHWQPLEAA